VITIDGVRVEYPDGFGLARASNTTPVVVTRFEADTPQALERIQRAFKAAIAAVDPTVITPF
jgi:phosphomannomutase/phosphoglucomutase